LPLSVKYSFQGTLRRSCGVIRLRAQVRRAFEKDEIPPIPIPSDPRPPKHRIGPVTFIDRIAVACARRDAPIEDLVPVRQIPLQVGVRIAVSPNVWIVHVRSINVKPS